MRHLLINVLVALMSCNTAHNTNDGIKTNDGVDADTICIVEEVLPTDLPQEESKFQSFDEFQMKGIGAVEAEPYVTVSYKDDCIIVKSSYAPDSARTYKRIAKDVWYNHLDYDLWKKKGYTLLKCAWDKPARSYDRYIYNDTIVELQTLYFENRRTQNIFVKTQDQLKALQSTNINFASGIEKLRAVVYAYTQSNDAAKKHCEHMTTYNIAKSKTNYTYTPTSGSAAISFERKAYGIWGAQPGIDETCLHEGQDIRNFSHSTPNGLADSNPDKVYNLADEMPSFPGDMRKFIEENRRKDINTGNGRVAVEFIVEKDGTLTSPKVIKSLDPISDEEVLRIVRAMPKWKAGELNGEKVRCKMQIPVSFKKQ